MLADLNYVGDIFNSFNHYKLQLYKKKGGAQMCRTIVVNIRNNNFHVLSHHPLCSSFD